MDIVQNTIKIKQKILSRVKGGRNAPGIPADYAQITSPDSADIDICELVERKIREFLEANHITADYDTNFQLHDLHKYLDVNLLADCQSYVTNEIQLELMQWACHIGKERFLLTDFFIDNEIYVRINFPFDFASKGNKSSDVDPGHRLTSYNKGRPKATWGHGPHKDSWYGHSHSAINLWFSICGTNEEATMTLYPEHAYKATSFNAHSMYASYSENLGENVKLMLEQGENFIFDPELLHSSRLNTSDQTRIVLTLRLSGEEPLFSNQINHDIYDRWVKSSEIELGEINPVKVGHRVNIEDFPETDTSSGHYIHKIDCEIDRVDENVQRSDFDVQDGEVFELSCADGDCLGVWDGKELYKFATVCPHIGAPLVGGKYISEKKSLKCPAHGVEFCLKSGSCGSELLRLKTYS